MQAEFAETARAPGSLARLDKKASPPERDSLYKAPSVKEPLSLAMGQLYTLVLVEKSRARITMRCDPHH
jgi:hypothetical protein